MPSFRSGRSFRRERPAVATIRSRADTILRKALGSRAEVFCVARAVDESLNFSLQFVDLLILSLDFTLEVFHFTVFDLSELKLGFLHGLLHAADLALHLIQLIIQLGYGLIFHGAHIFAVHFGQPNLPLSLLQLVIQLL